MAEFKDINQSVAMALQEAAALRAEVATLKQQAQDLTSATVSGIWPSML